jgi:hypothetical protein
MEKKWAIKLYLGSKKARGHTIHPIPPPAADPPQAATL